MIVGDKTKILISGANGLLGRHTLAALHQEYEVHAVVRTMPEFPFDKVFYHIVDLASSWDYSTLPNEMDTIIHLAQSSHFREFPEQALDVFYVNVESTARLLDYAQFSGVKRFIYASSGGVYGSGNVAFDENAPIPAPGEINYYLSSKLCGEVLSQSYSSLMNVIILRFFFMYGSGQRRSMLIPRLVDRIYQGQQITLQGKDGIRINPVHISDAVHTLQVCLNLEQSKTINLAGPDVLSIKSISEIIGEKLGITPKFEYVSGEPRDLIGNNDLMSQMLDCPLCSFIEGVTDVFREGEMK